MNITELSVEDFQRYTIRLLESSRNVTIENPDTNEDFPLSVVSNVMQSIRKTEDNIPIYTRFSITIDNWANTKYEAMKMFNNTNIILRKSNFALMGTPIDLYDEITRKHRYGGRYEVNYNGLTNSFERIL